MTSQESLTHKWLRQNIQAYPNKDVVYAHVDAVLARHTTIRPKTDVYTFDDGRTQLLLCLHGLLPITFRGASYNIPIAVWLTRDYPRHPPITYVVPTSDMLIRASPDVDVSGRCQIQYLCNWEKKSEGCNLTALLEEMQDVFSRVPPVYAKSSRVSSPATTVIQPRNPEADYASRPPPPLPGSPSPAPIRTSSTPVSTATHDERPPLPAKPGGPTIAPTPHPRASTIPTPIPQSSTPGPPSGVLANASLALRPPPPIPLHPPIASSGLAVGNQLEPPTYTPRAAAPPIDPAHRAGVPLVNSPSTSSSASLTQNFNRQASTHALQQPPFGAATVAPVALGPPPSVHPPTENPWQQPYALPVSPASQPPLATPPTLVSPPLSPPQPPGNFQPQPIHVPAFAHPPLTGLPPAFPAPQLVSPSPPSILPPDLLDADDPPTAVPVQQAPSATPAPPRPPNPELLRLHAQVHAKLQSELASLQQAMAMDAERLRAHQADLLAGEPAIRDEMARLEAVRDVCRVVADRMRAVVDAGTQNIAELRRKGDPEVDELVCSTTIVYNQLIDLVAEDNAVEDTIYHLHRALNTGRIDLERFIRTTRVLAEEQFMKRALIEKIQTALSHGGADMGWSMPSDWR